MDIYVLVGPSGTGKSHRAQMVAHSYNIDSIIDDGLLIKDNKVIAGRSAKQEKSKLKAVKRAIFMDPQHAEEVKTALRKYEIDSLLILGTSEKMINQIIARLELSEPEKIIKIEEIATPEEVEKARSERIEKGKHVIPVPTIEIKPDFSGYLMESLELLFSRQGDQITAEKTIVRPKFSYYGKLLIANRVIEDIIYYILRADSRIIKIKKVKVKQEEAGTKILMKLNLKYGIRIHRVAQELQLTIKELVEYSTGVNVLLIDICVVGLTVESN